MSSFTRPSAFPVWTDGGSDKVTQPPSSQSNTGWTSGEAPPYQYANWLQYQTTAWLQYLDQQNATSVLSTTLDNSMRMYGGGVFSFNLTTGVMAWNDTIYLAIPGIADTNNAIAAGSVTLTSGQVAYVQANVPFTTTGGTSSGSSTISNLAYTSGIATGQVVNGTGIPNGATVVGITGNTVTLSASATATGTGVSLTFVSNGTLTVKSANESALVANVNTVILARAVGSAVIVGVNSGQFLLRDGEQKRFLGTGYGSTLPMTAGVALSQLQAVYLSSGTADTRVAGSAYPVDSSVANGGLRGGFVGFVATGAAQGATGLLVTDGILAGFSNLVTGAVYYADPTTPGGITATKPASIGQYIVPVGVAISSTILDINSAQACANSVVVPQTSWPSYAAATEAQFSSAVALANTNGGVIVLSGSFSLSTTYTIGSNVCIQGRKSGSIITVSAGAGLIFTGDGIDCRDVFFQTSAGVNCIALQGNYTIVRACNFVLSTTTASVGIYVTGSAARLRDNVFSNVSSINSVSTGISYAGGADNLDDSSVFLS